MADFGLQSDEPSDPLGVARLDGHLTPHAYQALNRYRTHVNGDISVEERRQSYCPACGTRGNPTTVFFGPDGRTFSYKCPECAQEWLVQTSEVKPASQQQDP